MHVKVGRKALLWLKQANKDSVMLTKTLNLTIGVESFRSPEPKSAIRSQFP